jgi:hypothetical protein
MTFQEKKSLVYIATATLIFIYFWLNIFSQHPGPEVSAAALLHFWGSAFLRWIGVQIAANIITHILFSITNTILTKEKEPSLRDERDKLFDLKIARNSSTVFMLGFLLAMIPPLLGMPPVVMFNVLVISLLIAQIFGSLTEFFLYRRGY